MPEFDLYPKCDKPEWLTVGATCHCLGEGDDIFTVIAVESNAAALANNGKPHGWESFEKLSQVFESRPAS